MKACGLLTNGTAKELTGATRGESSEENTQATGSKTECMAEELSFIKTATDTMDIGLADCLKVKVA